MLYQIKISMLQMVEFSKSRTKSIQVTTVIE